MVFVDLEWQKASMPTLVQGVKGNKRPKNAVAGDNGSFLVYNDKAKLLLYLKDSTGKIGFMDVAAKTKKVNGWEKFSDNRVNQLKEKLKKIRYINPSNLDPILKL